MSYGFAVELSTRTFGGECPGANANFSHSQEILHRPDWWYTSAMETKPTEHGNIGLTEDQLEIVGQFNDYSYEIPI